MTLRHIEIFVAVCLEDCSITRAANRLHISQPTVSVAIQEIEAHYGHRLFDRFSNRLYITPFGRTIYDQALRLLNLYDDMINVHQSNKVIRVGTGTAIGKLLMPSVVKSFSDMHPEIQMKICVSESPRLYRMAMENELDLVIAETVDEIVGLSHRMIQQYPIVGVCHRSNPLAGQAAVTAEELARENLLLREKGSSTRYAVDVFFKNHNLNVSPMWESFSVQTLLNAAREGIGVAFLSLDHVLANRDPELAILNIPGLDGCRYVNVCFHKDKFFTPEMTEFLQFYEAHTRQLLEDGLRFYSRHS